MQLNYASRMVKRNADQLEKVGIHGPFRRREKGSLIVTDGCAAVFLSDTQETQEWVTRNGWECEAYPEKYDRMMSHFTPRKGLDVVVFETTIADLWEWAVLGSDACPLCLGTKFCPPPKTGTIKETPDSEDAFSVHYGWVGPVPIDRRRLQEVLTILNYPGEQTVTLSGFLRPATSTEDFFGGARLDVLGNIKGVIAGLTEVREGESRFQTDGKFTDIKLRHGRGR